MLVCICFFRIQKDAVDPEKLKATLGDEQLNDSCDMKRALEMVALLEAQIKDLNPNLDSIAEYECSRPGLTYIFVFIISLFLLTEPGTEQKLDCTVNVLMI